jgi:hypothetical protein
MLITIIQAIIFLSFISFLWIKFKQPLPSISESWYRLKYPANLLFTIFIISIGILMPYHIVGNPIFFLLSGAGLIFTGVASMFKYDIIIGRIHAIGAYISGIAALAGLGVNFDYWIPTLMFLLSFWIIYTLKIIGLIKQTFVWWLEIVTFLSVIIGLIYIYL